MAFGDFDKDPFFNRPSIHPLMMNPDMGIDRRQQPRDLMALNDPFMLSPFGSFDPFARMRHMMANFERMAGSPSNGGGHCYSQSTVMHYSSVPGSDGKPQIYQASSSTRSAPGGIVESRKMEKDSSTGTQKMAIRHQIGDRSHTVEKKVNLKTNDKEENHELINLTESDAPSFNREWESKTKSYQRHLSNKLHGGHHYADSRGLPTAERYHSRTHQSSADGHHYHPYHHHHRSQVDPHATVDSEGRTKKKRSKVTF